MERNKCVRLKLVGVIGVDFITDTTIEYKYSIYGPVTVSEI